MKLKKLTSLTIVFALVCTINTATFAVDKSVAFESPQDELSLTHISEPTRLQIIS